MLKYRIPQIVTLTPPEASASRYDNTSNSPTLHSIYNKSIYMKVRETRLLITFITLNFAEFQEVGNK